MSLRNTNMSKKRNKKESKKTKMSTRHRSSSRASSKSESSSTLSSKKSPSHKKPTFRKKYRPLPPDLFENLRKNIQRIQISKKAVNHIWKRHGCFENAEVEKTKPQNRGKLPSVFRSQAILEKAIASTLNRPNRTRTCSMDKNGNARFKKVGFKIGGIRRFRGKNYLKNQKKRDRRKKNDKEADRTLYFKCFTKPIGCSGRGYGGADHSDCYWCCAVVQPNFGLVTSFPILIDDAEVKENGEKSNCQSKSSSLTTSSSSMKEEEKTHDENISRSEDLQSFHLMSSKESGFNNDKKI